jgi:hypothetical protein
MQENPVDSQQSVGEARNGQSQYSVRETAKIYAEAKAGKKPELEEEILERASQFALEGNLQIRDQINGLFKKPDNSGDYGLAELDPIESGGVDFTESDGFFTNEIKAHESILSGQELKIARMKQYISDMGHWASQCVEEYQKQEPNPSADQIRKYTKNIIQLVVDAARSITFQDLKGSAVTLGDHGWMHLTQDLRDAIIIAEGKHGKTLGAKEKLLLGLAAAYHDIGYAAPQVSDAQRASKGDYGSYDKGHPLLSGVYVELHRSQFEAVLGSEDTSALFQIVVNHENPERAKMAGARADLAEAFAIADAGAAFGLDKLPPIITQFPEALAYLNAISYFEAHFDDEILPLLQPQRDQRPEKIGDTQEDATQGHATEAEQDRIDSLRRKYVEEVINPLKQAVIDQVKKRNLFGADLPTYYDAIAEMISGEPTELIETQAGAMVNALHHFNEMSLKFLLGRMSAESLPVQVIDGVVVFDIAAGFAREMEQKNIISGAVEASSRLSIKLFSEQAGVELSKELEKLLVKVLSDNSLDSLIADNNKTLLEDLGVKVETGLLNGGVFQADSADSFIVLSKGSISVRIFAHRPVSEEHRLFYENIQTHLNVANEIARKWVEKQKAGKQN